MYLYKKKSVKIPICVLFLVIEHIALLTSSWHVCLIKAAISRKLPQFNIYSMLPANGSYIYIFAIML